MFHGTRDPLVPYRGGMASLWGFRPCGLGLSPPATADYFAARNGITTVPESHRLVPRPGGYLARVGGFPSIAQRAATPTAPIIV